MKLSFTLLFVIITSIGFSQDELKKVEVIVDPNPVVVQVVQSVNLQYKAYEDGNGLEGAWGTQPHKGHVFYSDFNSGLWAAKVKPVKPDETKLQTK